MVMLLDWIAGSSDADPDMTLVDVTMISTDDGIICSGGNVQGSITPNLSISEDAKYIEFELKIINDTSGFMFGGVTIFNSISPMNSVQIQHSLQGTTGVWLSDYIGNTINAYVNISEGQQQLFFNIEQTLSVDLVSNTVKFNGNLLPLDNVVTDRLNSRLSVKGGAGVFINGTDTLITSIRISDEPIPPRDELITRPIIDSLDPFGDGSLMAKYQLNGDATDLTGNFNGTENNVTYEEGKFGQCGVFNGSNSYVTLGNGLFNTAAGFSFSLWVKTQSVAYSGILRQGISGDNPLVSLSNNGAAAWDFSIEFNDGDQYGVTIDANLVNNNAWHNVSASVDFEARLLKVYVDGFAVGSVDLLIGSFINMDSAIYLGGMGEPLYPFDGKIDQVEIYNRALTENEIGYLFKQEAPFSTSWLEMDEIPEYLLVYPEDAVLSTTVGTGFLNSSGFPVYYRTNDNISRGETKHIVNESLSIISKVEFAEDGDLTLTENSGVSTVNSALNIISFKNQNGQLAFTKSDGTAELYSAEFHYLDCFASVKSEDGETVDDLNDIDLSNPLTAYWFDYSAFIHNVVWSNRETIEQANPQPEQLAYHAESLQKVDTVVKNNPFYNDPVLDQNGEQRKFGYIESTTEISGVPIPNKRVLCFSQNSAVLIAETTSDKNGVYRFDHLLLDKKFMVTAQFGNDDPNLPPDYQAVSSDWQTPTPYGTENEEDQ